MTTWPWVVIALVACNGGDTEVEDLDPATVPLEGVCDMDVDYGGFQVFSSVDGAGVSGSVADGVVPISILEEVAAEGGCQMLKRNNPYCEPACEAGQACDWDGSCIPWPSNQDLGTVAIHGLAQGVEMEPVFPGNTYYDSSLPDPPWTAGELVTLDMPDGVYGPVTLHGVGVEPVEVLDEEWSLEAGSPLEVRWSAPTGEVVRSQVAMWVNIDIHGASPGSLACIFEDTGAATVPAALVQTLVDAGVTGFPNGGMERRTADRAAAGEGCMDLVVSVPLDVPVDVVGFTPCVSDEDCPDGMECNLELQVCE